MVKRKSEVRALQESCITASVSQDPEMLRILREGGDMHSEVAIACWPEVLSGLTVQQVKAEHSDLRSSAKGVEFGILYGGDDNTLHRNKGFPKQEAKKIFDGFMSKFSGIKTYQDYCRKEVARKWYILMNPVTGHRAHIYDAEKLRAFQEIMNQPGFWENYRLLKRDDKNCELVRTASWFFKRRGDLERASINFRIQNRGAGAFKLSMIKLFNWIKNNNLTNIVKIAAIVHDKYICCG